MNKAATSSVKAWLIATVDTDLFARAAVEMSCTVAGNVAAVVTGDTKKRNVSQQVVDHS